MKWINSTATVRVQLCKIKPQYETVFSCCPQSLTHFLFDFFLLTCMVFWCFKPTAISVLFKVKFFCPVWLHGWAWYDYLSWPFKKARSGCCCSASWSNASCCSSAHSYCKFFHTVSAHERGVVIQWCHFWVTLFFALISVHCRRPDYWEIQVSV